MNFFTVSFSRFAPSRFFPSFIGIFRVWQEACIMFLVIFPLPLFTTSEMERRSGLFQQRRRRPGKQGAGDVHGQMFPRARKSHDPTPPPPSFRVGQRFGGKGRWCGVRSWYWVSISGCV